jgi:hypothetical protein
MEGYKTHQERLRAEGKQTDDDDGSMEKKVSRFEGDIDLKGIDEADIEKMVEEETTTPDTSGTGTPTVQ